MSCMLHNNSKLKIVLFLEPFLSNICFIKLLVKVNYCSSFTILGTSQDKRLVESQCAKLSLVQMLLEDD